MKVFIQYTFLLYIIFFKLFVSEASELPDMEKYVAETGAQVKAIVQENTRLIEIGAGITGTYLVDKCLATDGIATLTPTIATSYNESLFEKYNGDVLIIIHIIYPEGIGGKKDVLDSTLLYSQRITSLLDPQKIKTTVHFWQVVNHDADQLYSFEHVIEASNINPVEAFDYEEIKRQVTSCSNLVCSIGAYAGIGETTSSSGLNALNKVSINNSDLEIVTASEIPIKIFSSVTVKFNSPTFLMNDNSNELDKFFLEFLKGQSAQAIFSVEGKNNAELISYWINVRKWVWDGDDEDIHAGQIKTMSFTYQQVWRMTNGLNNTQAALLQHIYSLYPSTENDFIRTSILEKYKNRYSTDLNVILRVAAVAKLLGKERWDAYPIILTAQTSNFSDYFDALYAYYKAYSKFDQILACNSPGTKTGQMTFILRTLSDNEYIYLPVQHRIHVLEVMSQGSMSGKINVDAPIGEEDIALKILSSTAEKDEKAILDALIVPRLTQKTTSPLIDLISGIDGSNYRDFILMLTDWIIDKYPNHESWQQILQRTTRTERNVLPLGDFLDGYSTEMGTMNSNSVFRFKITINPSFPIEVHTLNNVNAYDYIVVKFTSEYSFAGKTFLKGSIYTLPSIFVYAMMHEMSVHTWVTTGKYTLYAVLLAVGVGEIMAAQTGLEMTIAIVDMAIASNDILINEVLATKLSQTEDGKKFLDNWNKFALLYGGVRIYTELSGLRNELTDLSKKINTPETDKIVADINKKLGGVEAEVVVSGAGSLFTRLDKLSLTALKTEINILDDIAKARFLDEFAGASDDALRAMNGNASLVNYWKVNGDFIKNKIYPNVGHKAWDDTKNAIVTKADPTETKILNAIENSLPPSNNQVAIAGAYSPELGGNVVLKYNDKNFNVNLLETELQQHLNYLTMIKNDFDKGGNLYQKLYSNVPLEKIQNAGLAGTHAEVLATNEVIKQLKAAGKFNSIQDFNKVYVLVKGRPSFGNMCRCPHCFQIIDGVQMIGNQ